MSRYKGNIKFLGTEEYTKKMGYVAEATETKYHLKFIYNSSFSFIVYHKILKDIQVRLTTLTTEKIWGSLMYIPLE